MQKILQLLPKVTINLTQGLYIFAEIYRRVDIADFANDKIVMLLSRTD